MTTTTRRGRRLRPAEDSSPAASLAQMQPGQACRVESYADAVDARTAQRLRDLGFAPGERIEVIRRAPLGDPVLYRVVDTVVALRAAHTRQIRVRLAP